jgi:DNA-binding MarR family transcriptional regulator
LSKEDDIKPLPTHSFTIDPSPDELTLQVNLRLRLDEIATLEEMELRNLPPPEPTRRELIQLAQKIYEFRRIRHLMFDHKLLGEPAWDMLLALYCFPPRGEFLSVSALSYAAYVPQTTGLRWQRILCEENLIERGPKGVDARKQFMGLTNLGRELMEKYLTRLYRINPPKPWPLTSIS